MGFSDFPFTMEALGAYSVDPRRFCRHEEVSLTVSLTTILHLWQIGQTGMRCKQTQAMNLTECCTGLECICSHTLRYT